MDITQYCTYDKEANITTLELLIELQNPLKQDGGREAWRFDLIVKLRNPQSLVNLSAHVTHLASHLAESIWKWIDDGTAEGEVVDSDLNSRFNDAIRHSFHDGAHWLFFVNREDYVLFSSSATIMVAE